MRRRGAIASAMDGALLAAGATMAGAPRAAAAQGGRPELPPPSVSEAPASNDALNSEVWPEVDVVWIRSPAHRVVAIASLARGRETQYTELHLGLHTERRWPRGTSARAGLEAVSSVSDGSHREIRAAADVTPRIRLGRGWTLVDRNRVDLRLLNGELSARLRVRARVERTRKLVPGDELTYFAFVEGYHDTRYDVVASRMQAQLGFEWRFIPAAAFELAIARQWDTQAVVQRVSAIALTTTIYP